MPTCAALGLVQVWHILFSLHSGEEVMSIELSVFGKVGLLKGERYRCFYREY
jgi:hypothetical protein